MGAIEPEPVRHQQGLTLRAGPLAPDPLAARPTDVVQGSISACPIAAVMVALAHARPANLGRMLGQRQKGPLLSKRRDDQIYGLWSDFYYDVVFPGRGSATRITPFVYFDDQNVQYASTPNGAGWPSYIEKAYAVWKSGGGRGGSGGDYSKLDLQGTFGGPPTVDEVVRDLIGAMDTLLFASDQFFRSDGGARDIADGDIERMARSAGRRPTIAASIATGAEQFSIVSNHGYAILGFGNGVRLRNPWGGGGAESVISVARFRQAFQGIWQAV
jgi:hypothetical protein